MKATFKPRARLLKLLGDQLIGTPQLAVFELVKNAYDADADLVEVVISNPDEPERAAIEVTDFGGIGMDLDTITNVWLEPGADHQEIKRKAGIRTEKHQRLPLGEKGVGRFAVHKLGKLINVVTKAAHSKEISIEIDWDRMDKAKYIEEADIDIKEHEVPTLFKDGATGTKITITRLHYPLSKGEIRSLYRNIESIKSPFENNKFKIHKASPTIEIIMRVVGHEDWIEKLSEVQDIVDQAIFKFSFLFSSGKWSWTYEFNPNEQLKKQFRVEPKNLEGSNENCELADPDHGKSYKENPEAFMAELGDVFGEIYVFDFDNEVKKYYSETNAIKLFLSENKGIRVYRDGIRVYNYGEPNDDWLEMDRRRVTRLAKGLSRDITVGAISLDLESTPALVEKTNREGFIENNTFLKLKEVVSSALSKFEKLRMLDKERLRSLTKSDARQSISGIESPLEELKQLAQLRGWDQELAPTIARIEKSYSEMREIMLTAGMAGLNMSVAFHEIHRGIKDTKRAIESDQNKASILLQFERFELLLDTYARMLRKEKIVEISLKSLLEGNMQLANARFFMHDVTVSCPILTGEQPDYKVKGPIHLLTSAINNVIDNSIYWLDQRWGNDSNKKYIYIGVTDEFDKGPAIVIADNGPGWRNIQPEEVVKPFLTTKAGGMGIGLYYADTVMEMLGGELVVLQPSEVEVPKAADGAVVAFVFNGGLTR